MKISDIELIPGDIGLSTNNAWMSKSIRFFESAWTQDAEWSHVFCPIGGGRVVEALNKIKKNPISRYDDQAVCIYRIPLTDGERANVRSLLLERVNGAYGWFKYPLFVADAGTSWFKRVLLRQKKPCFFFTKTFGITNFPVCSQLCVWAIYKGSNYRFYDKYQREVGWREITPDYLEDLLKLEHNKAERIFEFD